MSDETIEGKYEAKLTLIPPPREYPTREKRSLPDHDRLEDVMAKRMQVVNSRTDWGVGIGAEE